MNNIFLTTANLTKKYTNTWKSLTFFSKSLCATHCHMDILSQIRHTNYAGNSSRATSPVFKKPIKTYSHLLSQIDHFDVTSTAHTYSHINKNILDSECNSLKIYYHNCEMHTILEVHHIKSSANLTWAFQVLNFTPTHPS
jgi:hypothetical protein